MLFGGMSESADRGMGVHNDVWFFDCPTRRWSSPSPNGPAPSPRYAHLSAVSNGKLVISGGQHADNSWVDLSDLGLKTGGYTR